MRCVFFARIKTDGTFQTQAGITPNPYNAVARTWTPLRTGAGAYTITVGTGAGDSLPVTQYVYEAGLEGAAANGNIQISVANNVATISTSVAAVATDENFWVRISEIASDAP